MAQKNDQVFQLSLTEIAFTISFILLLLLGYLVVKEQTERLAAEDALARIQSAENATIALDTAKSSLASELKKAGAQSPNDIITKLISADELRAERDSLKEKVTDLDEKLTALTELQNQLVSAAKSDRTDITKEEIESALSLQDQVRKVIDGNPRAKLNPPLPEKSFNKQDEKIDKEENSSTPTPTQTTKKELRNKEALEKVKQAIAATAELKEQLKKQLDIDIEPGQEVESINKVVAAAKTLGDLAKNSGSPDAIKKENSDLRGQVAFLKNRLDARGGRDYPPCWADESGKVEFLFAIEVKPDSVTVTRAWPPRREDAARALPGISEALGEHSNRQFISSIQGIFNWSKKQDPECRHYVQLKSSISDAIQSDRSRLMVENYFYKVETRR